VDISRTPYGSPRDKHHDALHRFPEADRETGLAARNLEHSPGPAYLRQMYERPPSRYDGEPGVMDLPVKAWL
jgi:hypothetical protein